MIGGEKLFIGVAWLSGIRPLRNPFGPVGQLSNAKFYKPAGLYSIFCLVFPLVHLLDYFLYNSIYDRGSISTGRNENLLASGNQW